MAIIRNILSYTLLLSLLGTAALCKEDCEEHADHDQFQKLLAQVDPPSLHAALHDFSPKKFSHGMFPEDRTALEAIHNEEPGVATGILRMARLGKRQNNGTVATTTVVPPDATTTVNPGPVPVSPQTSTIITQTQAATTSANNAQTSQAGVSTRATTSAAAQTTSAAGSSTPASSPTSSGAVFTTTDSQGRVIVSTVGGGATTLAASQAGATSSAAERSSITSYVLQTSTLPNGEQSTLTAVTVIAAGGGEVATATQAGGTRTSGSQPGLQTGEATMTRGCGKEMVVVLGAAVGMAFML